MAKKVSKNKFVHAVAMNDIVGSMDKVIERLHGEIRDFAHRLTPIIIQLVINDDITNGDLHQTRLFLKALRKTHNKYFIRFSTSILWAAESDNTDIFYTRSEDSDKHADVVIKVKVFDKHNMVLNAEVTKRTPRHSSLKMLSKTMVNEILAVDASGDELDILASIADFYLITDVTEILKRAGDDHFHILFIPSLDGSSYYTIPLYGMSYDDAKRRYLSSENALEFLTSKHKILIPDLIEETCVIDALVELIQRQEEDDANRYETAKDTYALAELLYAYYTAAPIPDKYPFDRHQALLFEIRDMDDSTTLTRIHNILHDNVSY